MQQLRQDLTIGDIRRRRRNLIDQPASAVNADMRLHAEIPLLAFPRLMHRRIVLLVLVLR